MAKNAATKHTAAGPIRRRSCIAKAMASLRRWHTDSGVGHAISENRNGLILGVHVSEASGTAECAAALMMLDHLEVEQQLKPKTLGADRGYDTPGGGP